MAKAATATESPAPADDQVSDVFDVVVPEVEEGEAPLRLDLEAETPEETPQPKPAKAAKAASATPEEPVQATAKQPPPLDPAAHQERVKRKQYARLWETAAAERDEALAQIERLRAAPNTAANREARKLLVEKADAAGSMGALTEVLLEEFDRRDQAYRAELFAMAYEHAVRLSDVNARIRHKDYDEVLQKAGILEAVQVDKATGQWKDPNIAKRIYHNPDGSLRADPGEQAYRLAVGRLEYDAEQASPDDETPAPTGKKPAPSSNGATAAAPSEDAVAAARREGAREVQEKVVANASRPKGIGGIRSAGPPGTSRLSRQQLDELMEREPRTYERLVKANPELERWHLGG